MIFWSLNLDWGTWIFILSRDSPYRQPYYTAQHYEDIHFKNVLMNKLNDFEVESGFILILLKPWKSLWPPINPQMTSSAMIPWKWWIKSRLILTAVKSVNKESSSSLSSRSRFSEVEKLEKNQLKFATYPKIHFRKKYFNVFVFNNVMRTENRPEDLTRFPPTNQMADFWDTLVAKILFIRIVIIRISFNCCNGH